MDTKAYSEISEKALITELFRRYRQTYCIARNAWSWKGDSFSKNAGPFLHVPSIYRRPLREEVRSGSDFGKRLKGIMDRGELIEDEVMCNLIKYQLSKPACANGAILDGFPRTIPQAQKLDEILKQSGQQIDQAIFMNVREDTVIDRLGGRWTHLASGRTYNYKFNPPKQYGKDDITGEDLIQREDDKESTIRNRLRVYQSKTSPIVDYYRQRNILHEIDAERQVDEIWRQIKNIVKQK
ncbi:unnamed protein product (macronuclear) [Paramecium tetraurelia]|uniref:Adenylate kinase active site lid domain-containing protein n=1 Tax=Paramecium tetraurelia TaxID=5888 RepID=A0E8H8_PARTE|nr:uncharacterized protein GSPATT00024324001 [Paramecium tetraurelia]CAK91595.1 unnamed protein product [Paramecium tetraurelia]|eukprot:XP_001458992.1 hypothetical protein (macronuclear) [Paramecium tetraurelia strain d4-2]